jgi:hypothetical protein
MIQCRFNFASLLALLLLFTAIGCITRPNGLTRVAPETFLRHLAETDSGIKIAFAAGPKVFMDDPELNDYCRTDFTTILCAVVQWHASPLFDVDIPGAV